MLSKNPSIGRDQLEMITLDQLVPAEHPVRKMEGAIDFSFMYDLVKDLYSEVGRPSIDPVILIKLTFIQYKFGIRSMRQTIKETETNMAYRWFLGYGFHDKIPHFSTFGKNYERRFKDTDLFEQIFYHILKTAAENKLISADHVFIDSTHVKASANKHKFVKKWYGRTHGPTRNAFRKRSTKTGKTMGRSLSLLIGSKRRKRKKSRKDIKIKNEIKVKVNIDVKIKIKDQLKKQPPEMPRERGGL